MIAVLWGCVLLMVAVAAVGWWRASSSAQGLAQLTLHSKNTIASLEANLEERSGDLSESEALVAQLEAMAEQSDLARGELEVRLHTIQAEAERNRRLLAELSTASDPMVLWALERSRSERTWRYSVASSPDELYAPLGSGPLTEVLKVEVQAVREEVGTAVELDLELPADIAASGCLLILRVSQELLASVVHRSEVCVLRIRCEGHDAVVDVIAEDEHGSPVPFEPLPIPASRSVMVTQTGYRVHGVRLTNTLAEA